METEITLTVECEGEFVPEAKAVFTNDYPNGLPGEPAQIKKFRVLVNVPPRIIGGSITRVDITMILEESVYDKLYKEFLEQEMSK